MADGCARVMNGKPAGVFAMQYGPGAENAFAGIASAYSDSTPVLLLPLGHPRETAQMWPLFNSTRTYASVTKSVEPVTLPEHIVPAMRRAFNALKNGRSGPVMVEVPADVMTAEFAGNQVDYTPVRRTRSAGDARDIDDAAKALIDARSPMIIAGQGVLYAEASDELVALADLLDIPVMTTTDGKSGFPEDHALALGSGGIVYTGHGRHYLHESDVILAVGTSLTKHNITTPVIPGGQADHPRHQRCARPQQGQRHGHIDPRGRETDTGATHRGGEGPAGRQGAPHRSAADDRQAQERMARALGSEAAVDRTPDLPVFRDVGIHAGHPVRGRDRHA